MATHSTFLLGKFHGQGNRGGEAIAHGVTNSYTTEHAGEHIDVGMDKVDGGYITLVNVASEGQIGEREDPLKDFER